jgi:hypothetical protein
MARLHLFSWELLELNTLNTRRFFVPAAGCDRQTPGQNKTDQCTLHQSHKVKLSGRNFGFTEREAPIGCLDRMSADVMALAGLLGHSQRFFYQIGCDRESVGLGDRLLEFECIIPIGGVVQHLIQKC